MFRAILRLNSNWLLELSSSFRRDKNMNVALLCLDLTSKVCPQYKLEHSSFGASIRYPKIGFVKRPDSLL